MKRNGRAKILAGNPEWEAVAAARGNYEHHDAVKRSFSLQQRFRSLWSNRMPGSAIDLYQILRTLTQKRIRFVLTGAYGISGWTGKPRATQDVDILVKGGRTQARAVSAIKALYPHLQTRDFAGVTAFLFPGEKESVIDVTYPHREDLEETLANPVWTEDKEHGLRYRVPSLEAALANKYGAMLTPTRDPRKRGQDAVDFAWMVTHSLDEGRQPIDLTNLEALGEKVWPAGGGKELLRLVEQAKAGGLPTIPVGPSR
jgi:hypothetical protein